MGTEKMSKAGKNVPVKIQNEVLSIYKQNLYSDTSHL